MVRDVPALFISEPPDPARGFLVTLSYRPIDVFPFRVSPEKSSKATIPASSYNNAKHRSSHAFIQRENEHAKVAQGAGKETVRIVHDEERDKLTSDHTQSETMTLDQDSQDVNTGYKT